MQYPIVVVVNLNEYALCVFDCKHPVVGATPQLTHLNIFGTYQAAVRELARLGATTHSVVYRDVPVQLLRDHQKVVQWRAFKSAAKKTGLENGDRVAAYLNGGALLTANLALATMRQFENATHVLPESITTAHGFSRTFGDAIQHPDTEGSAYLQFSDDRVELNVWTWRGDHIHLECQFYPSKDAAGVAAAVRTLLTDKTGRWAPRMTLSQLYVGGYCSWTNINDWQWYEGVSERTTLQAVDSTRCYDVDLSTLQAGQDLRFALEKYTGKYGRDGVPLMAAWAAMSIIDNHGADLKGVLSAERAAVSGQGVSGKIARTLDQYGLGKLNQFGQRLTQTASKGVFLTSLALALAGFALAAGWELNSLHNGDMQLANRQAQAETERDKLKTVSRQAQIVNTSLEWFNQRNVELEEYKRGQEQPADIVKDVYDAVPFYLNFPLVQIVEIKFDSSRVEVNGFTDVSKAAAAESSGSAAPPHLPPNLFDPVNQFQKKLESKTEVFARLQSNYDHNKPDGAKFTIASNYIKPWRTDALKPLPIPQVLVDAAGQNPTLLSQKVAQK
ncbi:MAG TPA: hypothetical protein PLB32_22925 [Acidobacteriota bacterium]|nr:hypothetical protein [Acidobacteriota bacterium]HNG95676.1 hypothetical protein [Acidobacteriota bacterium]